MSDVTGETAQIERDLDATRARIGGTLDALQNRLSPGQMFDDFMTQFRDNGGAAFGRNLLESVRTNPMPAALTGIGLVWLMASNGRTPTMTTHAVPSQPALPDLHDRLRTAEAGVVRTAGEEEQSYTDRLASARGQVLGLTRSAQETASTYAQRVSDAIGSARDSAAATLHDVRDGVSGAAGSIGSAMRSTGQSVSGAANAVGGALQGAGQNVTASLQSAGSVANDTLSQGQQVGARMMSALADSPVLLGVLGLAAGAVLGAILPMSAQEETSLGGLAASATDQVKNAAHQIAEQAGTVAEAVAKTAQNTAADKGLTGGKSLGGFVDAALSGELAGGAAETLHSALKAGEDAAHEALHGKEGGA